MGYLLALTAIFFWSFNLIIATTFATSLLPLEIACGRWLVASLILVPMAWGGIKANFKVFLRHWPLMLVLALTGVVFDNTLIYYAGHTASTVNMGVLDVTGPIFLVILTRIFLKVKISIQQIIGLTIAVVGVWVIILQGDFTKISQVKFVSGDFIMLINTLSFAVYSFLQTYRPKEVSQREMLGATVIIGLVFLLPAAWLDAGEQRLLNLNMEDIGVMVYLGIFNSVISYLAWNTALSKIGNVKTSIIYYLLPLFSGLEAYFILHEKIYASQIWGGMLVILGIALVSLHKRQNLTKPENGDMQQSNKV